MDRPRGVLSRAVVVLVLLSATCYAQSRIADAEYRALDAELRLDSAEAAADSSSEVWAATLGDNARAFQRRGIQLRELNDSLSSELGREARARVAAEVRVDSLSREVEGALIAPTDSSSPAVAEFNVREPPFAVWARVRMSDPPVMRMEIVLDPVPLTVRIGCEDVKDGLRKAYASLEGPVWAHIRVTRAEQEAGVCNPRLEDPRSLWAEYRNDVVVVAGTVGAIWATVRIAKWIIGG